MRSKSSAMSFRSCPVGYNIHLFIYFFFFFKFTDTVFPNKNITVRFPYTTRAQRVAAPKGNGRTLSASYMYTHGWTVHGARFPRKKNIYVKKKNKNLTKYITRAFCLFICYVNIAYFRVFRFRRNTVISLILTLLSLLLLLRLSDRLDRTHSIPARIVTACARVNILTARLVQFLTCTGNTTHEYALR
jgi:hypothetical protein